MAITKNYTSIVLGLGLSLGFAAQASWFAFPNAAGVGAQKVSVQKNRNQIEVDLNGFEVNALSNKDGRFSELSIPGAGFTSEVGQPKLPVIRQVVEVPADAALVEISDIVTSSVSGPAAGLAAEILPVQLPVEKIPGALAKAVFQRNNAVYSQDAFFPNFQARVAQVGSVRGRHFAIVEVAPVRFNPSRNQIEYISHLSLKVVSAPGARASTQQFSSVNFDQLLPARDIPGMSSASKEKLLIIVGRGFEADAKVQELIAHKQSRGFEVASVNVKDIGTSAPQVRSYIQNVYKTSSADAPLTYVLLIGDVEQLQVYSAGAHVTDNYYAAVDKPTYNEDKSFPDLAVGRLTAKNAAELQVMVDKIIRYETHAFTNRQWIKKIAFLATDDRYTVAEGTHNYVIDTYTKGLGYTGIFPTAPTTGADKLYAITYRAKEADVMKSVNDGRLIVNYSGHGATTYWDAPRMTQSDVHSISNGDALPYVMSHACISGSFAMRGEDSFGETWLKEAKGGIGFWGTSNSSYWDEDDILERRWFDGMFKDHIKTVGLLNLAGKQGVRLAYTPTAENVIYYYEIYNLLGDPTIQLLDQ